MNPPIVYAFKDLQGQEVQIVFNALMELPAKMSIGLIQKLQTQVQDQEKAYAAEQALPTLTDAVQ